MVPFKLRILRCLRVLYWHEVAQGKAALAAHPSPYTAPPQLPTPVKSGFV